MNTEPGIALLQETLAALSNSAVKSPHAIALIGAGSAGSEISRMDQYSDIDFFLIVEDGFSQAFIDDNSWFGRALPIVFAFRDTEHGNKVLLENGVFLEFAIFTNAELALFGIPGLRIIWSKPDFVLPDLSAKAPIHRELSYYVDQALSNLLVGALRLRRGEKLAALAMIERYAFNNLLTAYRLKYDLKIADPFNIERRAELLLKVDLAPFLQGYEKLEDSVAQILAFAKREFEVNTAIICKIEDLLNPSNS